MDVFETSKLFPREEIYSLTNQVRRSSRSVCANIAEAYRKKMYPAHFVSKVSDSDTENTETNVWMDFSLTCKYVTHEKHEKMILRNEEIGRLFTSYDQQSREVLTYLSLPMPTAHCLLPIANYLCRTSK